MERKFYPIIITMCIASIVFGIFLSEKYQEDWIYPLDMARALLIDIQASSDPQSIQTEINQVENLLPKDGNPVWLFSTGDTDFGLMQKDLSSMRSSVTDINCYPVAADPECNTIMYNVHTQATTLVFNLLDTRPFMYLNVEFIFINLLWVLGTFGLAFIAVKKR